MIALVLSAAPVTAGWTHDPDGFCTPEQPTPATVYTFDPPLVNDVACPGTVLSLAASITDEDTWANGSPTSGTLKVTVTCTLSRAGAGVIQTWTDTSIDQGPPSPVFAEASISGNYTLTTPGQYTLALTFMETTTPADDPGWPPTVESYVFTVLNPQTCDDQDPCTIDECVDGECTHRQVCSVDLDIDSDNDDGVGYPTRSAAEDALEDAADKPGKFIAVNDDDDNQNTFPDKDDTQPVDNEDDLVPMALEVTPAPGAGIVPCQTTLAYKLSFPTDKVRVYRLDNAGVPLLPAGTSGQSYTHRVWLRGDMNADGAVNGSDAAAFNLALSDFEAWRSQYLSGYADMRDERAPDIGDFDSDRRITSADLPLFNAAVAAGGGGYVPVWFKVEGLDSSTTQQDHIWLGILAEADADHDGMTFETADEVHGTSVYGPDCVDEWCTNVVPACSEIQPPSIWPRSIKVDDETVYRFCLYFTDVCDSCECYIGHYVGWPCGDVTLRRWTLNGEEIGGGASSWEQNFPDAFVASPYQCVGEFGWPCEGGCTPSTSMDLRPGALPPGHYWVKAEMLCLGCRCPWVWEPIEFCVVAVEFPPIEYNLYGCGCHPTSQPVGDPAGSCEWRDVRATLNFAAPPESLECHVGVSLQTKLHWAPQWSNPDELPIWRYATEETPVLVWDDATCPSLSGNCSPESCDRDIDVRFVVHTVPEKIITDSRRIVTLRAQIDLLWPDDECPEADPEDPLVLGVGGLRWPGVIKAGAPKYNGSPAAQVRVQCPATLRLWNDYQTEVLIEPGQECTFPITDESGNLELWTWLEPVTPGEGNLTLKTEYDGHTCSDAPVVKVVRADLEVDGKDENEEETPGAFIPVNGDFDEQNIGSDGQPVPDYTPQYIGAGQWIDRIVAGDDELRDATLKIEGPAMTGRWKLSIPDSVMVWRVEGEALVRVNNGILSDEVAIPTEIALKVEGITAAPGAMLVADFGPTDAWLSAIDQAQVTVLHADLDVDSDNDNGPTGGPNFTNQEEYIEEQAPGKYVVVNDDHDEENADENDDWLHDLDTEDPISGVYYPPVLVLDDLVEFEAQALPDDGGVYEGATIRITKAGDGEVRLWAVDWWNNDWTPIPMGPESNLVEDFYAPGADFKWWDKLIEGLEPGPVDLELTFAKGGLTCTDKVRLSVIQVDLDVDSDNTQTVSDFPPDRDDHEDGIEDQPDRPGRVIPVNSDDDDECIVDFADGYNVDALLNNPPYPTFDYVYDDENDKEDDFVKMVLEVKGPVDWATARVRFRYDGSDPLGVTPIGDPPYQNFTPADGHLRIWTKPGNVRRDGHRIRIGQDGDYVAPYHEQDQNPAIYPLSLLGVTAEHPTTELWVEAVRPSTAIGADEIKVELDPNADVDAQQQPVQPDFIAADAVRFTAVEVGILDADMHPAHVLRIGHWGEDAGAGLSGYDGNNVINGPLAPPPPPPPPPPPGTFIERDPDRFHVRVADPRANANPAIVETVPVMISTLGSPDDDATEITLEETGPNTGVFESESQLLMSADLPVAQNPNDPLQGPDDDYEVYSERGAGMPGDDILNDRTHRVGVGGHVRATYAAGAAGFPSEVPVCEPCPVVECQLLRLRVHVFNEPFIDIGNGQYDVGEPYLDNNPPNGYWNQGETFVDVGNGTRDPGEVYRDISGDGDCNTVAGTQAQATAIVDAQIERANIAWAQACIRVERQGAILFEDAPRDAMLVNILWDWDFDAGPGQDEEIVILGDAGATYDIAEVYIVAPIREGAYLRTGLASTPNLRGGINLPVGIQENTYLFVDGTVDLRRRTLAHEIGHALTNRSDTATPLYVFFPSLDGGTFDDRVNQYRRITHTTETNSRTRRTAGMLNAVGNRLLSQCP